MKILFIVSILISSTNIALAENDIKSTHFSEKFLAEKVVLLNLKYKSGATVVREIKFYGNRIDPNRTSIRDRFSISIDNKFVKVPKNIYSRLHELRRSFSYDELSGGIVKEPEPEYNCLIAGPAEGLVLEALYLTYTPRIFKIIKSEMKPVFSLAYDCLFNEFYTPLNAHVREDARAVIEILNTVNIVYGQASR